MKALENKIPPPIVAVLFAVAMWGISGFGLLFELNVLVRGIAIAVLLLAGAFFSLSGMLNFKKAETTVNPLKPETASSLVVSGIYQVTRNPMYVGMVLFLLAWGIHLSSVWAFFGVPGFVLYMNRFQIAPEERALAEIFGAEFENYQSKVRRWL